MDIIRNILLNPGPATTTDRVKYAQVVPDICPREREFVEIMHGIREDLVRIVHGDTDRYTAVLFCGSGTINMDVCLNSLLPDGKKALVISNGAYSRRAADICRCYGLRHRVLEYREDRAPDLEEISEMLAGDREIALVYATHHETGTGLLNPIREIGRIAHENGAVFVVDTTSSYGMIPIEIEADNIDFCMASAQKGIMAMTGLSFVIGNRRLIEESAAYPMRSYYCNLYQQYAFFEESGEMRFTPPVQTVYAARQALEEYRAEGERAKWERHKRAFRAILDGLERLGFQCLIDRGLQSGLVAAVRYPDDANWDFEKVHDYCYERGFTIYPGKVSAQDTFRLCAMGAIDAEDIRAFFTVFEDALRHQGVRMPAQDRAGGGNG